MFHAERTTRRPAPQPWHREHELPPSRVVPSVLAAVAALVATWPFTSVIAPGSWSFAVLAVIVVTAVTGVAMRTLLSRRSEWIRELATMLAQVLVAIGTLTQIVAADTALFGIIPTDATLVIFGSLSAAASEEIAEGSAPIEATAALRAVMGLGFAAVAILLDHLMAHRSAVIAVLLTGVVGAVPMIATMGGANVVWFVMLGILVLLVLRYTAAQDPHSPRRSSAALASVMGVTALAATVVIAPVMPVSANLAGTGVGVTVDASLRLGDDLRQPNPVEVLTLATTAENAPYLRLTTLSNFNGRVWQPDEGDLQSQSDGFGPEEWGTDIASEEQKTSVRILRMSSGWLPVPYPATDVQGIPAAWRVSPDNRTIVSRTADAVGNDYTVRSALVTPTVEQIRAVDAADPIAAAEPVDLPEIIRTTAAAVTADASNDYDRLIALQTWFRSAFVYSLETPVEEGFDGTGADAVARFLEARSGYCIHFAGAFALMAESLGMEVRIVVGYLPGSATDEKRGAEAVYSVFSDQLHSWPEVLFPGIGWVPFEPTASLGVPTAFVAGSAVGGGTGGTPSIAPTTAPEAEESTGPEIDRGDTGDEAGATGELRRLDPTPVLLVTLGILLLLMLPALIRIALRAVRRSASKRGDAGAAWSELRATLVDLGLAVSDADSPRMRAAALARDGRVNASALRILTDAVEEASYARSPGIAEGDLDAALGPVLADLRRSVDRRTRLKALILPRSLLASRASEAPLPV